jgi:hypothetical protein
MANVTEHGAPVVLWTVRGEMDHRSTGMIKKVYGHTMTQRTRVWSDQRTALPEVVELSQGGPGGPPARTSVTLSLVV